MKKTLVFTFFLWTGIACFAQNDFTEIDSLAETFSKKKYKKPEDLVPAMMNVCNSDIEKARIIFTWVAKNVRYDYAKFISGDGGVSYKKGEKEAAYKELAHEIYKDGKGVCMDYSALFQELCNIAGIECAFISGLTRSAAEAGTWGSHAWNAIKIDGKWYLIDVTWASGYIKKGRFKERFSQGYFMTRPDLLYSIIFPKKKNGSYWKPQSKG